MCRECALFDNNYRQKRTENLRDYNKSRMFTRMGQALGGLSLRYNTIFDGERIKIKFVCFERFEACLCDIILASDYC